MNSRDALIAAPQEIVARLHEQIAARSPEHAALVADFERWQAERDGTFTVGPGSGEDPLYATELAEDAPAPPPGPAAPPAGRCDRCGYLTTAAGHRVTCDE